MKNAVSWDVTPCSSCEKRRFGGMCRLHHQVRNHSCFLSDIIIIPLQLPSLLLTANVVPSSLILIALMMEICSSETLVLTRSTWRHIPEDGILQLDTFDTGISKICLKF
jgi:hypothetical protein